MTAAFATSVASASSSRIIISRPHRIPRVPTFRCSAEQRGGQNRATPVLQVAVGGVTELLRLLSPKKQRTTGAQEVPELRSVDDVVQILLLDFDRAYFLTGNFTSDIYDDDCLFEDPTIRFRGKNKYSQNLDLLVPFFDHPSLKLEKIEKGCNSQKNFILARWLLRTYLKFPWRPLIVIKGMTRYDLGEDFKIIQHSESWDTSAFEAVAQIFKVGPRDGDGQAIKEIPVPLFAVRTEPEFIPCSTRTVCGPKGPGLPPAVQGEDEDTTTPSWSGIPELTMTDQFGAS